MVASKIECDHCHLPLPGFELGSLYWQVYNLSNILYQHFPFRRYNGLKSPVSFFPPGYGIATAILTTISLKWLIWYEILQIKASLQMSPKEQGVVYA